LIHSLAFRRLTIRGIRNLASQSLDFDPRLNVVTGHNGQGKSSLLEALALVATSRSFRTEQVREVIRIGEPYATAEALVDQGDLARTQRVVLGVRSRRLAVDEKPVVRIADYATRTPIVLFCPKDLDLVSGTACLRRTLLDRVSYYQDATAVESRKTYLVASRERQRLLAEQGVHARGLEAYEVIMAEHGARWTLARRATAASLVNSLQKVFSRLAPDNLTLQACLRSAGTENVADFQKELAARRAGDALRGKATFGPQRDDLELALADRPARRHASQGQQRLLALSLKLAELDCIMDIKQVHPVLLLDDVASELDQTRTERILAFLLNGGSQVFLTTTAPEMLSRLGLENVACGHFEVDEGHVRHS
jgi:DNA replication and repair protein RecF